MKNANDDVPGAIRMSYFFQQTVQNPKRYSLQYCSDTEKQQILNYHIGYWEAYKPKHDLWAPNTNLHGEYYYFR